MQAPTFSDTKTTAHKLERLPLAEAGPLFVVLAFLGHASLWAAIAADMGVSLLVTFNALRLLR